MKNIVKFYHEKGRDYHIIFCLIRRDYSRIIKSDTLTIVLMTSGDFFQGVITNVTRAFF